MASAAGAGGRRAEEEKNLRGEINEKNRANQHHELCAVGSCLAPRLVRFL